MVQETMIGGKMRKKYAQSMRFQSNEWRTGNSENRAVIRAKLTVLSRLAAIQIELTIVMRREGSGRR